MSKRWVWSLVGAPAMAAVALGPVIPASAAAGSQRAINHVVSAIPLRSAAGATRNDTVFNNVDYNGGPLMPANTDYLVFWSPSGVDAYPNGYISGLNRYFTDLAHDSGGHQNVDSVSAQYRDLTGAFSRYDVTFGGGLLDTDPFPASQCPTNHPVRACFSDLQLQQELERFVAARDLKTDLSHEYFLLMPPHVESCFSNDPSAGYGGCSAGEVPSSLAVFCAYHEQASLSPLLFFANDPFVPGNPGCDDGNHPNGISDGELIGGLSHEHNESITDPIPNDAWTNGAGPNHGLEVGDQCDGQMGTPLGTAPNGAMYNQVINGHFYWYQEEWSNKGHTCLQRLGDTEFQPTATFTVTAGSGLTLKFDATGSTAPGGVADYVWQFNDAFGASTIERTTPRISHTFPSAGAYSIGLTIFSSFGSSTGTGAIVTTGRSGFTRGFTYVINGHGVSFHGLTNVSAQPVLVYLWEFGDGTTGSGANPRHTYARPGTFTVTLVLFSGIGSAFPGAGAAPVTQQAVIIS